MELFRADTTATALAASPLRRQLKLWPAKGISMQKPQIAWWVLALAAVVSLPAWAGEIIELKSGHTIEGEVIRERPEELIVDIGVDIVRIPVDRIRARRSADQATAKVEKGTADGFYLTADLPKGTVRDLSAKFGEGVVLVSTPSGLGSGFIINARGYCVTNFHVIEGETRIAVTIYQKPDGKEFEKRRIEDVKIIALNPFLDLALIKIPEQKDLTFKTTYLSSEEDLVVGDPVFAIGNPLGLERSVSEGIISTKNRNFEGIIFLQTTTQINPGNSGGPLFNFRGEVVGVTSMKVAGGEGLGFAIPIDYVRHFLDNREAFAYDRNNPNNGYRYLDAPRRRTHRDTKGKTEVVGSAGEPKAGP